jgi:hypothetical protein
MLGSGKIRMSRQSVDEKWLLDYLNAEIHRHEECATCQFSGIMRLRGTDESGCNWSPPWLRSSGQPSEVCLPIAQRVVAEAMKKFNLKAEVCDSNQASGANPTLTISMLRRMLYIPILHIDANLINARGQIAQVNQLERWFEDGVILINISSSAHIEAQAGNDHRRTRKATQQIFTATPPIRTDDPQFKKVELSLFPCGAQNENQRDDVRIVCEAAKYHAILVTGDGASKRQPGGILGNREKIRDIKIMSPDEAVDFVRKKIRERDEFNRRVAEEVRGELPQWTGQD